MSKAVTTEASEDGVSISVSEFPTEFSITVPVLLLEVIVDKVEGGFFDAFDLRVSFGDLGNGIFKLPFGFPWPWRSGCGKKSYESRAWW